MVPLFLLSLYFSFSILNQFQSFFNDEVTHIYTNSHKKICIRNLDILFYAPEYWSIRDFAITLKAITSSAPSKMEKTLASTK